MKLKSIELKNHPVLKNIKIDFDNSGVINDITLLIGENGCGKTIILETIFGFFSGGITLWNDGIDRVIDVIFSEEEKTALSLPSREITFKYDSTVKNNWSSIKMLSEDGTDISGGVIPDRNGEINKHFKCLFSTVEINFAPRQIDSVKANSIDNEEVPKSKSSVELANEIAQLLVDIRAQDAADSDRWMKENQNKSITVPVIEGKLDRFKNAYKKMFDGKELGDIRADGGIQKIMFRDVNGNEFGIENLSSGEKQVVYRVGYLLRNFKTIFGGIALIDEPELSLHPRWQIKYLNFLKEVFGDGSSTGIQFIIATHSPYLIKNTHKDIGVSILSKESDNVNVNKPGDGNWSLFKNGPTLGEINYYAFKMPTIEFHNELYGYIQEVSKNPTENSIEKYFLSKSINIDRPWVRSNGGALQSPYNVSLMTFIRNSIHHPENNHNTDFTPAELRNSIEEMIRIINSDPIFT